VRLAVLPWFCLLAAHVQNSTGYRSPVTSSGPPEHVQQARIFRLPPMAYLAVVVLLFCVAPLAFASDGGQAPATAGAQTMLLVVPVVAALLIARTATVVDTAGITVRLPFGRRTLPWPAVRGLSVSERSVYAVTADGAQRLPCVRVTDLADVSRASGGHLPKVADAPLKAAPSRQRRRR
jgi:hypothetical protein